MLQGGKRRRRKAEVAEIQINKAKKKIHAKMNVTK